MSFNDVRCIIEYVEALSRSDLIDYIVVIYSIEPLYISKTMVYGDIPDCFNCKVHAFDIDLDKKIIYIRSEVVNNE